MNSSFNKVYSALILLFSLGIVFFAITGFSGCNTLSRSDESARNGSYVKSVCEYPKNILAALPDSIVSEIHDVAMTIPVPNVGYYNHNDEMDEYFSHWYRIGYAYVLVTGRRWIPDQISRDECSMLDRIRVSAWLEGNSDGAKAKWWSEVDLILEDLSQPDGSDE